jgi:flagellar protein FliO/FliZ
MSQTLVVVILFIAAMAALPWLVKRLQQRHGALAAASGVTSKVLSAVAVGPQQRVVTVEVAVPGGRTVLVLGVTAQQIQCLHVLPVDHAAPAQDFSQHMSAAKAQVGSNAKE